ncbi:hypothetical protein JI75_03275 [Berryella intestinalis]|uniref:16S rRNA (Guanine(966)-N(2))-methyltransferase RsmD n=1 Tax=Berryella intestinalis TaxID=1531429 RepID=A0A0A8B355_9ACTN|nr:16S rRNA (guanine(966)-N(2))-methyltransferase RsmD [Berryella intestinalis]AJC11835.1 hypothetical protein JI75_03275 [Berryella intestinalis]
MRIIAGQFKGRPIDAPAGDATRPTVDRVREALFSSLISIGGPLEGACVLDAFAGSGALGIESLSRGAARAVFCECDPKAHRVVVSNLARCKVGRDRACVLRADVFNSAARLGPVPFNLVFLDPPYRYAPEEALSIPACLAASGMLAEGALVAYEFDAKSGGAVRERAEAAGFSLLADKRYGKTGVAILQVEG